MNFNLAINQYIYLSEGINDFPYHNELYKKIWNNYRINDEIKEKLLKVAKNSCKKDFPINFKDIILTGSLCDFNYTKTSDIDLHIIVDISSLPSENKEFSEEYLDLRRKIWNEEHDIEIFGHNIEIYFQSTNTILHANGIFSLLQNKWLKIPKYSMPNINHNLVDFKYSKISSFIGYMKDKLDTFPNESRHIHELSKRIMNKIKKYRDEGLNSSKEIFSSGNLLFKKLRNKGDINTLSNIIDGAYDNIYSISDTLNIKEFYDPKKPFQSDYEVVTNNPNNRRRKLGMASPNKHKNVVLKATKSNAAENQKVLTLKRNNQGGWFALTYQEMLDIVFQYNGQIPQKLERKHISHHGVFLTQNEKGHYFVCKDKITNKNN